MTNLRWLAGLMLWAGGSTPTLATELIRPAIDGTGTIVRLQSNRFDIHGGTQVGNNLFHSFVQFNLNRNQTANFISNPTVQAILARIGGGDASVINGLIQVTGGTSNLFLINPAGLIFGSQAQLDVPASFTATTANAVQFNAQWLPAIGATNYQQLSGSPAQLAFLTPNPGWIVQTGALSVRQGRSLSLVGGVVVNTGTLMAPGGRITIAAIPGEAAVRIMPNGSVLNLDVPLSGIRGDQLALPRLLTGGQLESATGVRLENGVIRLTQTEVPAIAGTAIATGTISAIGGFVETSGKTNLDLTGINLTADTWLIDPSNIDITNTGTGTLSGGVFDPLTPTATIRPSTIAAALNAGTNVTITTASGSNPTGGDITLSNSISSTGAGTLTLISRRFLRPGAATIAIAGDLTFNLNWINPEVNPPASSIQNALDAGSASTGNRTINLGGGLYSTTTPIVWSSSATLNGDPLSATDAVITGNNVTRIFEIQPGVTARIQNVTLRNGRVGGGQSGGAIENLGNLTLVDSTVSNSVAGLDGGGISTFGTGAALTLINSTIENNRAQYGGGLSSTNNTNTTIIGSTISDNIATEAGGGIENTDGARLLLDDIRILRNTARYGGGLTLYRSQDVVIRNSILASNTAQDYGGGLASDQDSAIALFNSTIILNRAINGIGGGIYNNSPMQITGTEIRQNQAISGGGIETTADGTLSLDNAKILLNTVTRLGGGINSQGQVNILGSQLSGNVAQGDPNSLNSGGGAIYLTGNRAVLTIGDNSILSNNRAVRGGAIDNTFSNSITIDGSTLSGNIAQEGGAIVADRTTRLTIRNSQILGNQAQSLDAGAIYASFDTTIQNTLLQNNVSARNGGAIYSVSPLNLSSTTIADNRALQGGGIYSRSSLNTLNSTLSSNVATDGGGLFIESGAAVLNNSTLAYNQATSGNGGIVNQAGTVDLFNTIVAANQFDVSGVFRDRGNNLIGVRDRGSGFTLSTLLGTNAAPLDPGLAALASQSVGTTPVHALLSNSPAIDAGNNTDAPALDQRAVQRIQGTVIDIGAFESSILPPTVPLPLSSPSLPPVSSSDLTRPAIAAATPPEPLAATSIAVALDQSLTRDYAEYYGLSYLPQLTLKQIQTRLAQSAQQHKVQSAIVYATFAPSAVTPAPAGGERLPDSIEAITPLLRSGLKRDDDRLDLILVTPTGRATRFSTSATRSQVKQQSQLFRLAASDLEDEQSYRALSQQLYGWLLEPLEPQLQQEKIVNLLYCMDEGLRAIPLAVLSDQQGSILDRYAVSTIPSAALLNPAVTSLSNRPVLAMGADHFANQSPLPAVPTELKFISDLFWKGDRFLNQEFTLDKLLQHKAQQRPGILHLATHADFKAGSPSQSYIQFWDRPLHLHEQRQLTQAFTAIDLLILSACKTALGSPDAELGFTGFAAATGVPAVIGSLWEVSDLGTLALMSEFYTQLRHAPTRTEALRRSQKAMLTGRVRIEDGKLITSQGAVALPPQFTQNNSTVLLSHPYYWSAFILTGNPW
jgi:filamentous hemagglutinin family protein